LVVSVGVVIVSIGVSAAVLRGRRVTLGAAAARRVVVLRAVPVAFAAVLRVVVLAAVLRVVAFAAVLRAAGLAAALRAPVARVEVLRVPVPRAAVPRPPAVLRVDLVAAAAGGGRAPPRAPGVGASAPPCAPWSWPRSCASRASSPRCAWSCACPSPPRPCACRLPAYLCRASCGRCRRYAWRRRASPSAARARLLWWNRRRCSRQASPCVP
jgi:hypothetical protein